MNINGLTQAEIEAEFDMSKVRQNIKERVAEFSDQIDEQKHLIEEIMSKYLKDISVADVEEVTITLLSILGNSRAGISLGEDSNGNIKPLAKGMKMIKARDIPFNVFIKTLYKDRYINETFKHLAVDFCMDLAVELDEIFFDIVKRTEPTEDGQFHTLTYVRSEILFIEDDSLRAYYERFRLPLIETPIDWKVGKSGGYHLNRGNCMTNRGDHEQPQLVLNSLNKLQRQAWTHSQDINDEFNFNVNKFIEDGDRSIVANKKAEQMALTCQETYDAIGDRNIYFEWKFDARGRMYSTGYDINIQGNKAKKGALRPVLW